MRYKNKGKYENIFMSFIVAEVSIKAGAVFIQSK